MNGKTYRMLMQHRLIDQIFVKDRLKIVKGGLPAREGGQSDVYKIVQSLCWAVKCEADTLAHGGRLFVVEMCAAKFWPWFCWFKRRGAACPPVSGGLCARRPRLVGSSGHHFVRHLFLRVPGSVSRVHSNMWIQHASWL